MSLKLFDVAHIFLSAAHKSSGKTTVSIGISAALARGGMAVQTYKKGPDYIDPMWLARASGRACYNLDFNTMSHGEIEACFGRNHAGADLGLIEGNKGLYDGLDVEGADSNAALAKLLGAPVALVVNAEGITRGVAPLVVGYTAFDPDVNIAGIILNSLVSARQEGKMRAVLERYTDIPVIGAIGRDPGLVVSERHLGLTTPGEAGARDVLIARMADAVAAGVDLQCLTEIAGSVPAPAGRAPLAADASADVRIGIVRDTAFGFYYRDDLEQLRAAGAELVFFDALSVPHLPRIDGLFIGGGFPETHMAELEANRGLRAEIATAIRAGLPTYAECGGLMYLCRAIHWHGERRDMVGVIGADAVMHEKSQGRGLVRLAETGESPWPLPAQDGAPSEFRAHEFHYAGLENLAPETRFAYRVLRGHGVDGVHDGIVCGNLLANFAHLRSTAANPWAERFVDFVRRHARRDEPVRQGASRPTSEAIS